MSSKHEQVNESGKYSHLADALNKDEYFKHLIEKQVEERTKSQLNQWWRIGGGVVVFVLAVVGMFGYHQSSVTQGLREQLDSASKDIREKAELIDEQTKEANKLVSDAKNNQQQVAADTYAAKSLLGGMKETLGSLDSTVRETQRSSKEITNQVLQTQSKMIESQQQLINSQAGLVKGIADAQQLITKAHEAEEEANKELKKIQDQSQEAATILRDTDNKVKKYPDVSQMENELNRTRSLELVMLRAEHVRDVKLRDFYSKTDIRDYTVRFITKGISPIMSVKLQMISDPTGAKGPMYICRNIDVEHNQAYLIPGTRFIFGASFILHSKLSRDFIALKVIPMPKDANENSFGQCEQETGVLLKKG